MSEGGALNMVMVGRIGNGKSASGNTILGTRAFESRSAMASVTSITALKSATLDDGQIINVIDTPGLFDPEYDEEKLSKEIVRCLDLVKDGIHAILLVFKVNDRFSQEELMAIDVLKDIFSPKILDYMIILFTGVDMLDDDDDDDDVSPGKYLDQNAPQCLKRILYLCRGRRVFFNNREKDEAKRKTQVQNLLELIDHVIQDNEGEAFTNKILTELQEKHKLVPASQYQEMLVEMEEMMEAKVKESIGASMERMIEEMENKLKLETANAKVRELQEKLKRAKSKKKKDKCNIM